MKFYFRQLESVLWENDKMDRRRGSLFLSTSNERKKKAEERCLHNKHENPLIMCHMAQSKARLQQGANPSVDYRISSFCNRLARSLTLGFSTLLNCNEMVDSLQASQLAGKLLCEEAKRKTQLSLAE